MLVEGAKERNLKLAFTFVCDSRDKHEDACPDYVKEAGAEGFTTTTGSVNVWTPYPDDPIFQREYEEFLTAFAAKYNDPDVTQFVSGFGLGPGSRPGRGARRSPGSNRTGGGAGSSRTGGSAGSTGGAGRIFRRINAHPLYPTGYRGCRYCPKASQSLPPAGGK